MRRRLLNLLTALSLLLCVAMTVFWLRRYAVTFAEPFLWRGREWAWEMHGGRYVLSDQRQWAAEQERLRTEVGRLKRDLSLLQSVRHQSIDTVPPGRLADLDRLIPELTARHAQASAESASLNQRAARSTVTVTVPCVLPAVALAALPAYRSVASLRRARERRRRSRTSPCPCPACGYDLRATPGGCPECGSGREAA